MSKLKLRKVILVSKLVTNGNEVGYQNSYQKLVIKLNN